MNQFRSLLFLLVGWCATFALAATAQEPAPKKLPVPAEADIAAMQKTVGDLYKSQFDAAKSPDQKAKLAAKILSDAEGTKDDPVGRFVLYRAARKLAAAGANLDLAARAVESVESEYAADGYADRLELVKEITPFLKTAEGQYQLARYSRRVLNTAVADNRFDVSLPLANAAVEATKLIRDAGINRQYEVERDRIVKVAAAYEQVKPALAALEKDPVNPAANAAAGKFTCFAKGELVKGLPMLALGDDAAFKDLAARDLKNPTVAAEQLALADGWYEVAQKQDAYSKTTLLNRASYWYRLVLPSLSGLNRTRVDNRVKEIDAATSPFKPGEWIELLEYIDLPRDRVSGSWSWRSGDIWIPATEQKSVLGLPVIPDGAYELRVRITRDGKSQLGQYYLPLGPKNGCWSIVNGWKAEASALQYINGKEGLNNPSRVPPLKYSPGAPITVGLEVEPRGDTVAITVTADGKKHLSWQGPLSSFSVTESTYPLKDRQRPAIGTREDSLLIHSIRFKLKTGTARLPD